MNSGINVEHDVNIHLENKGVSRRFFIYLFLMYALVYMTKNCFNGALAAIVEDGVLTKSQTGLITALFYIVYTPLQIVGGIVVDKFSPELMIKIGLVGGAVANAVIFFNHNYYVMLIAWTLNAVVQFALWPATYKIISSQLCRSDRTYMIFLITLATSLGLVFSYAVAAILPSWEYNFVFSAIVLLVLAIVLHAYDRRLNKFMKPDYEPIKAIGNAGSDSDRSTMSILWKSGFLLLLIPVFGYSIINQGSRTFLPLILVEDFGKSAAYGNSLNTIIVISGVIGTLLVKFVLYPKIVKNEIAGIILSMSVAGGLCILLLFVSNLSVMVVSFCAMSLITVMPALFCSYFNARFVRYGKNGTAAGISNAAASLALAMSSYVVLKISEAHGWQAVKMLWLVVAVISLITLIVIYFMNRRFRKTEN